MSGRTDCHTHTYVESYVFVQGSHKHAEKKDAMAEAESADAQPSRRMQKMRQVLEKVLVQSVDSFNFVDMHKCYPTIAKKHGNLLSSFCTDLLQSIRDNVEVLFSMNPCFPLELMNFMLCLECCTILPAPWLIHDLCGLFGCL